MTVSEVTNIRAALKHNNRVSKIKLENDGNLLLRHSLAEMQEPFPMLDYLDIRDRTEFYARPPEILPDSFLGGSAPRLVHLGFGGIPFPGLPKLLLSANHLEDIYIWENPPHISPEAMVASLCTMKHFQSLYIGFQLDSNYHRASQLPHPITRIVLPALNRLRLECTVNYVEDLVAGLDAPSLELMEMLCLSSFDFDFSELPQFISRIEAFEISDQVQLFTGTGYFKFLLSISRKDRAEPLLTFIGHSETLWSALPPLQFERLEIHEGRPMSRDLEMDAESELRELSHRFTAVKDLFLDSMAAVRVGDALTTFAEESMTELFPALQNIFFEEFPRLPHIQEAIFQFIAARQFTDHPVTLHNWDYWGGGQ